MFCIKTLYYTILVLNYLYTIAVTCCKAVAVIGDEYIKAKSQT